MINQNPNSQPLGSTQGIQPETPVIDNPNPSFWERIDPLKGSLSPEKRRHLYFVGFAVLIFFIVLFATGYDFLFAYIGMATFSGFLMVLKMKWYVNYVRFTGKLTLIFIRFFTWFIIGRESAVWLNRHIIFPVVNFLVLLNAGLFLGTLTAPFYIGYRVFRFFKPKEEVLA